MNLLLKRAYGEEVETFFLDKFKFPDVGQYLGEDILIVSGFAFYESQRKATEEALVPMENPFSKVYHLATFGDVYQNDSNFVSYVDEENSPVKHFNELLTDIQAFTSKPLVSPLEELLEGNKAIIEETANYNRYELQENTLKWVLLVDMFREYLPCIAGGTKKLETILEEQHTTVQALESSMNNYMSKVIGRTSANVINNTVVCFCYAEQYVNEIAHKLIDFYLSHNYTKVIVFVGRHTKGDDMFSVRSHGVDAGEIAYKINRGQGKSKTAMLFLGDAVATTRNTLLSVLSDIL